MRDETSPTIEPAESAAAAAPGLQFERVEPLAPAPTELACLVCRQPLRGEYFEVNGNPTCGPCHAGLVQHFNGPISWRTWGRVLVRGGGMALLGTILYFAVLKLTGYELGLIAVVVGVLVGSGVRKASGQRGGWKLQAAAMALTYASIVASYMPSVYNGLVSGANKQQETKSEPSSPNTKGSAAPASPQPGVSAPGQAATGEKEPAVAGTEKADSEKAVTAGQPDTVPAEQPTAASPDKNAPITSSAAAKQTSEPPMGLAQAVGSLFIGVFMLFFIACLAPFLAGIQNFMGWIIIGIALYEAWKINRRVPLIINGPIPISGPVAAAAVTPPATAG